VCDRVVIPRVLLVTGAYYPEISAAAGQCRAVAACLEGRVAFSVLTTAVASGLPAEDRVDGTPVHRVPVDLSDTRSKLLAPVRLMTRTAALRDKYDLVHIHGVSRKNVAVTAAAKLFAKPVIVTLHTAGQEEPASVARRGLPSRWALSAASRIITVSPLLTRACRAAGLPDTLVREIPNGVDLTRFRPPRPGERLALREDLGWPAGATVLLFVGFFSGDKRPVLAFEAFRRIASRFPDALLVYVGATKASYYEIDSALAADIRARARQDGLESRVRFIEPINDIERCYRAADVYLLSSARESCPLALLEAMASGLPSVASRLPGATDALVDQGVTGHLIPVDEADLFAEALSSLLADPAAARTMGDRARAVAASRFDIADAAERWRRTYDDILNGR
jgi:glycosyltransferase involved in cell wall biosynthesis